MSYSNICFTANGSFVSYDGISLVICRIDGSLCFTFRNKSRFGLGYFNDPYKNSINDNRESSMGLKYIAVNKNNILLSKDYDHIYISTFNFDKLKNIEQVDNNFKKGNPSIEWECKINPLKLENERYCGIGFLNDENIFAIATTKLDTINIYICNLKTNEWININEINDTETFNFIDNNMLFFLIFSKTTDNLITICYNNDKLEKKTFTLNDIKNIACSRQTKMLSKFNQDTKILYLLPYEKLFVGNLEWEMHPIKFIDDKEFYITHNITDNAYIIASNKNIYIKLIGLDEWYKAIFESKDVYKIFIEDTLYDTTNVIWSKILVHEDKVVLVSLNGCTYYLKYTENGAILKKSLLPQIYGNDKIFNTIFASAKFNDKYTITYNEYNEDNKYNEDIE